MNDSVEMFKPFGLQNSGVHIIFKMLIIERNSDAVQSQASKIFRIVFSKEIFKPLVEEEIIFLLAKYFEHSRTMRRFVARETSDEVLHALELSMNSANRGRYGVDSLHPSSKACTPQNDWAAGAINDLIALDFQHPERHFGASAKTMRRTYNF
jgi:hypothetical protein